MGALKRSGYFVWKREPAAFDPSAPPETEPFSLLDTAREAARKRSAKEPDWIFVVWAWDADSGLRRARAYAMGGRVHWMRPCPSCAGSGCVRCDDLGAEHDPDA